MMKILILNWRDPKNPKSGGAELVTQEYAKAWVKAGHSVTWFTSYFPQAKKKEIIDGVEVIRSGSSLSVYLIAPFFYLFSKNKFDVVIDEVHGIPFFTPLYVRKRKLAFIHEVAGDIWDYMYPFPLNLLGRLAEKIMFIPYKNTPFITVSNSTKKDLTELGLGNIHVVINGISIKSHSNFLGKEKEPTFIFVSRLVKMKGIEQIIASFSLITKDLPKASLWIVGGGEEKYVEKLKKIVRSYHLEDNVQFWGKISEERKLELMRKAHILLHASVKEGWGLVVLEAASQGTPAIVYKVPGLVDSVRNEETGIIVKENTPKCMAEEIVALYKNKEKYTFLQKNAYEWANSLTWEKATAQTLKILSSL